MFDNAKQGKIESEKIRTILNTLGAQYDPDELEGLLEQHASEGESNSLAVNLIHWRGY